MGKWQLCSVQIETQQNLYGEKEPTKQSSPTCGLGSRDLPRDMATAWRETTNTEHGTSSIP